MTFLDGLKGLKGVGGKFLRNMAINMFLEQQHGVIISGLAMGLATIDPTEVHEYIYQGKALPIPEDFYPPLFGFEDFLESFEETTLFEWIREANPLIAAAIMDCGTDGVNYIIKLKRFIIDTVKERDPDYDGAAKPAGETGDTARPISQEIPQPPAGDDESEDGVSLSRGIPMSASRFKVVAADDTVPENTVQVEPKKDNLSKTEAAKADPVFAKCDECGWEEYLPREQVQALDKCPVCGKPA